MFFLTPRYLKHGRQFVKDARKLLAYKRDLWSDATIMDFESGIRRLEDRVHSRDERGIAEAANALDKLASLHVPPATDAGWRENVEVFLVAIVVALGVRTYFLQPFTIPTGSMQPTLNGIIGTPTAEPPPNIAVRALHKAVYGRSYFDIKAKGDEVVVQEPQEVKRFLILNYTRLQTDKNVYFIHAPKATLNHFGVGSRAYRAGDPIVRGYIDTGDHVFVDKFTYHFRKPRRAEVFVFSTTNITRLTPPGQPSQFYIKRLAGLPGDTLRIEPPRLFINGEASSDPRFQRVMSGTPAAPAPDGYRGYGNGLRQLGWIPLLGSPEESFTLPARSYLALGDNSYNSLDSRAWGSVPESNIMGRAVLVYWPFLPHWGRIW